MKTEELKDLITLMIEDKKGEHITTIDLRHKGAFADFMVVASAASNRQLAAMADFIMQGLKERGLYPYCEGLPASDWVLVDAGDVIVHLFKPEARTYYNLEKMWNPLEEASAQVSRL
jgi:ribosome silencing factor RsfS/YbeB/iojap